MVIPNRKSKYANVEKYYQFGVWEMYDAKLCVTDQMLEAKARKIFDSI